MSRRLACLVALLAALLSLLAHTPARAARDFDGTDDALVVETPVVTAAPLTIACWFNSDSATANQSLIGVGDKDATNQFWTIQVRGDVAGDPVRFNLADGIDNPTIDTTTGYTVGTWHHACGVSASATDHRVFIDGGSKQTSAVDTTPSGVDRTRIGNSPPAIGTGWLNGRGAHAAIWNVALSDDEVLALAKRKHPLTVRRQSIVFYAPLHGDASPETDFVGGNHLTLTSAPAKLEGITLRGP